MKTVVKKHTLPLVMVILGVPYQVSEMEICDILGSSLLPASDYYT